MQRKITASLLGGVVAIWSIAAAHAQTVLEQAMEHRYQLDLHVPDAALQKMLPAGWQPDVASSGAAKDANIRLIFIDRIDISDADGKPLGKGSNQVAMFEVPVKSTSGSEKGRMIIAGLSKDASAAPGLFGVFHAATKARMTRSIEMSGGATIVTEDWSFAGSGGEHMQVHVKFERGAGPVRTEDTPFFDPSAPAKHWIVRNTHETDITRNAIVHPPDRVKEFSYQAGGGRIAALFDGTQKVISWDSQPSYNLTVLAP